MENRKLKLKLKLYRVIKKSWFSVLEWYPVKIYKKIYDVFPYMNTHYFHFKNQTLSLKLKKHFTAISPSFKIGRYTAVSIFSGWSI